MMNKKILGIVAITVAFLFLMTPVSAMLSVDRVEEEPAPSVSVIPQSEFVITLGENEKVTWTADYVIRDDDIAYVTVETTTIPILKSPLNPPEPCYIVYRAHRVTARNWFGFPLFFSRMAAYFSWSDMSGGFCNGVWINVVARGISWRYDAESIESEGTTGDYGLAESWTTFVDYLIHREPVIYISIRLDDPYDPFGGTTYGGHVYWWGMP